jgi:hypothetical protein
MKTATTAGTSLALRTAALGSLLLGGLVVGVMAVGGASADCASLSPGAIKESADFTPAEVQRGGREHSITSGQQGADLIPQGVDAPQALGGRALQFISNGADGSVYLYYLDAELNSGMTASGFLSAGGIAYLLEPRDPRGGDGSFAESLLASVPERAVRVRVGSHDGALTWADPTKAGVRSHNLYWADDDTNFSLIAVRGPEELVNMGRALVCGQSL